MLRLFRAFPRDMGACFPFLLGRYSKFSHSDQVVSRRCQSEVPVYLLDPFVTGLPEIANYLDPAEGFFNPLSNFYAHLVPVVSRCPAVDS